MDTYQNQCPCSKRSSDEKVSADSESIEVTSHDGERAALALLHSDTGLHGYVYFEQQVPSHRVYVWARVFKGLSPGKQHAFHIHEYGDARRGCASMGGHYNPYGKKHGSVLVDGNDRHAGDLINNLPAAGRDGSVQTHFSDSLITLFGDDSIYGCSVVIHAGTDDLGLGGTVESLKSGTAGERIACAPIVRCEIDQRLRFS